MAQPVNALSVDKTKTIVLLELEVNTLDGPSSGLAFFRTPYSEWRRRDNGDATRARPKC
jgi:hypothetical protein